MLEYNSLNSFQYFNYLHNNPGNKKTAMVISLSLSENPGVTNCVCREMQNILILYEEYEYEDVCASIMTIRTFFLVIENVLQIICY